MPPAAAAGLLFVAGQVGNAYHHWLLANLRKPSSKGQGQEDKAYKAPKGGLFSHIVCPHYT